MTGPEYDAPRAPFEQIVRTHGVTVLRVCRAMLGYDEADDAWSETFLSAMRAYPQLPDGSNIEAWLVTIAKRKAFDRHRSAARRPVPMGELPERVADDRLVPRDDAEVLWQAIKTLPTRQREAVAYHYIAGLPYKEIAAIVGGTESAARRAAADGMKSLRADDHLRETFQMGAHR